jgi:hypothetical protein
MRTALKAGKGKDFAPKTIKTATKFLTGRALCTPAPPNYAFPGRRHLHRETPGFYKETLRKKNYFPGMSL